MKIHIKKGHDKWKTGGENIKYGLSAKLNSDHYHKTYYSLYYEYDFDDLEEVYFAFSEPYSYSDLHKLLATLKNNSYVEQSTLCTSLGGAKVPLLTITNKASAANKYVVVNSRVHPGETCSSLMMEGFIKFISGQSDTAIALRNGMVFVIVPMINPEGVILGNYRCSITGQDLNRQYLDADMNTQPNVASLKNLIGSIIEKGNEIVAFLDLHSHSRKKAVFAYGPYFPLHNDKYIKQRILPKIISERTQMFRYYGCKFRYDKSKMKAARLVIASEFGVMNSLTIEASFYAYVNADRETVELIRDYYVMMGSHLLCAIYEYHTIIEAARKEKELKEKLRQIKKLIKSSNIPNEPEINIPPEIGSLEIPSDSILPIRIAHLYESISNELNKQLQEEDSDSSSESSVTDDESKDKEKKIPHIPYTKKRHLPPRFKTPDRHHEQASPITKITARKSNNHKKNKILKPIKDQDEQSILISNLIKILNRSTKFSTLKEYMSSHKKHRVRTNIKQTNTTLAALNSKHKSVDESPKKVSIPRPQQHYEKSKLKKSFTNLSPVETNIVEKNYEEILVPKQIPNTVDKKRYKKNLEFELFPLLDECKSYFRKAFWGTLERREDKKVSSSQSKALRAISIKGRQLGGEFTVPGWNDMGVTVMKKAFLINPRKCPVTIKRLKDNVSGTNIEDIKNSTCMDRIIYR